MRKRRIFPLPGPCKKSTLCVSSKGGTPERRKKKMKRIAVCAFLGALLWFPILGGIFYV